MLRHREQVYWQSVRWFATLPGAMIVGASAWPTLVVPIWSGATGVCALAALVMCRQASHLAAAWTCYKAQWESDFFSGDAAKRDDWPQLIIQAVRQIIVWPVRWIIPIGFLFGAFGCAFGAYKLSA